MSFLRYTQAQPPQAPGRTPLCSGVLSGLPPGPVGSRILPAPPSSSHPPRVLSLDSCSFLSLWPDLVPSSHCLTSSIWPPDGRLGLLLQPAALAHEEGAPQSSPPLLETGTWAEEEAKAGQAPTMCQTRSQTPSLWFNILLTPKNTRLVECY